MTFKGRVFSFDMPALIMGCGARERLGEEAGRLGKRLWVVTDERYAKQEAFGECVEALRGAGLAVGVYTGVEPDPPIRAVEESAAGAREFGVEAVVGIGGGSSLDVAKCTAVVVRHGCEIASCFGTDKVPGRGLGTVLVPTTAGSGSEVTPIAILSDEEAGLKRGIVSDALIADVAVVDPELCATLPAGPTGYTGMDALTHAVEAYTNRFAAPLIDVFAIEAVRLVGRNLKRCVAAGSDVEARYRMSLASLLGGMCLKAVSTAGVHALAYPLGCAFGAPHGIANSLLLPHVMRFNAEACKERYARIAEALGAEDAVRGVEELSHAVGTDRKMREFGVGEEDLAGLARAAMEVRRLLVNNPREIREEEALAIYKAAW